MSGEKRPAAELILQTGLREMDLDVSQTAQWQLLAYLDLLQKWNTAFNLSGVRDGDAMVSRHLLDSLTLLPLLNSLPEAAGGRIIDVGTGPGLPGIPLAICRPDLEFILLDSNGKKTRFVFQARLALKLANVSIENCRIEHYQCQTQIDIVVSRAFSSLAEMVARTRHLSLPDAAAPMRWLAMKGSYPASEIAELPADVHVQQALRVTVPGESAERHIIDMRISHPETESRG
jgi:16S rRNA (guanine527-N7)-methyltransferase